ncbi:MAG: YceI family protein [Flavisolibacter sp.]
MAHLKPLFLVFFICVAFISRSQDKYYTKSGKIEFYSKASLEDIEAKNKTVSAILDSKSGILQFSVLMKSFEFEKALMEEHFNSDYVESEKYPKAEFKGTIVNNSEINYTKEGTYQAHIKGQLMMHGVTKNIETTGIIRVTGSRLETNSTFTILLSDFNIRIPSVVKDKVSRNIKINVDCKMEPL